MTGPSTRGGAYNTCPMHGSLLYGFKQYLLKRHGTDAWNSVVKSAGADGWYLSTKSYPDAELTKLIEAAATFHGVPVPDLLEAFGEGLVPTLLSLYGALVQPSWRTLDLLVHAESVIHRPLRRSDPQAAPPRLVARRLTEQEVRIEYSSARRLCSAIGICRGVAAHYREQVSVEERECMLRGNRSCVLTVQLQAQQEVADTGSAGS